MTTSTLDIPAFTLPKPKSRIMCTKAQWKSLVEEFHTSDFTKAVFCKRHGIATSCLYRWEKLLTEDFVPADFIDVTEPVTRVKTAGQAPDVQSHWQVELELGADVILRVRTRVCSSPNPRSGPGCMPGPRICADPSQVWRRWPKM